MIVMTKLRIAEHPFSWVGFGVLAGVWLASYGKRDRVAKRPGAVSGALGTIVLQLVRDAAMYEMTKLAKVFVTQPEPSPPTPFAS